MNKLFINALVLGMGLLLAGYPAGHADAAQKIKVSCVQPENDPQTVAMKTVFKKYVEEKTNGRYEVDVYSGGSLGNFDSVFQGVQFGTIHIATESTANLSAFAKQLSLCDMPYLFPSIPAISYIFEQPVGRKLLSSLESKKVTPLAVMPSTFRIMVSTIPLKKLEDLKNIKFRTTASKSHMNAIAALGPNPTPMPATEMLTGLQQGVVKALDQDANSWVAYGCIDVAKYALVTDHIPVIYILYCSTRWLDKLPAEDRAIILEAVELYRQEARKMYDAVEEDVFTKTGPERGGIVSFLDDAEKERWKKQGASAYDTLSKEDRAVADEILKVGEAFMANQK